MSIRIEVEFIDGTTPSQRAEALRVAAKQIADGIVIGGLWSGATCIGGFAITEVESE